MTTVLLISFGASISTFFGGLFAIRFKDKLHLILGLSAGALIGAAFFDLLPESIEIGSKFYSINTMFVWVAVGILVYLIIDRALRIHTPTDGTVQSHVVSRSNLGALTLVIHSFFDGIAIGLASFVPSALPIVAAAVVAHDFSDGINTVSLVFRNDKEQMKSARLWLALDALAPLAGAIIAKLFVIPEHYSGIILAVLAGFFVYIGLSDLLPESYHGHPTKWTTIATIIGAGLIFVTVRLAGM